MNDTLIFFVLAIIALVFKWLTKLGAEKDESQPPPSPNEQAPRAPAESEQERVRRFLEALGAPPGSEPPPPIRRREVVPRQVRTPPPNSKRAARTKWEQPLPPLTSSPLPPPIVTEIPPPAPIAAPPPPAPVRPLPAAIPRAAIKPAAPVRPASSLGELLRRRGSVRQAVLLREILGPPRGLNVTGWQNL